MPIDGGAIFQDLLRAATLALFATCAFYVRGIATEVKEMRRDVQDQGERLAALEGIEKGRRSDDHRNGGSR